MPYIRVWIHFVWSTKGREKLIHAGLRPPLLSHITENAKKKSIFIDSLNCVEDHIHLLVSLGSEQTLSKMVQLIKGESSFWINKNELTKGRFEWQGDYFAVSVSESGVAKVRSYIKRQEEHHRRKSYQEEYEEFIEKYGFDILKRG